MELAYENAPVGIVLAEKRVIQSCNATFADLFGWPTDTLIGQSFRVLYASEREFKDVRDVGLTPLQRDGTYSDERLIRRRDGARVWCRFRARTLTPDAPLDQLIMTFAPLANHTAASVALTPRERDVIAGLSHGQTSKEIARDLNLSPRSVEDVRARLLRKFKARNATEVLARLTGPGISS